MGIERGEAWGYWKGQGLGVLKGARPGGIERGKARGIERGKAWGYGKGQGLEVLKGARPGGIERDKAWRY